MPAFIPVPERLEKYSVPEPNTGCKLWLGPVSNKGYGQIGIKQHQRLVHRVAWEMVHGPIPAGLWILHKCDQPSCFRIDHLFAGDRSANMMDMWAKGRGVRSKPKDFCRRGHPREGGDLYVSPRGFRVCMACKRLRDSWAAR